jgi:predicted GTPase
LASGKEAGVGHDLQSCTSEVKALRVPVPGEDANIVLVDTPGFDDTHKSDYEILQLISEWLKQT